MLVRLDTESELRPPSWDAVKPATWQRLQRFGTDAFVAVGAGDGFTYSTVAPVRRIDAVFANPRLQPVKAEVIDTADVRIASDHRPLVVEYLLDHAQHAPGDAAKGKDLLGDAQGG